jgi:trimethylamine:corrinoid methyltransferase-like protein
MKTIRFEGLTQAKGERIHADSMEVLTTVGIKVDYAKVRDLFRQAGADFCVLQQRRISSNSSQE